MGCFWSLQGKKSPDRRFLGVLCAKRNKLLERMRKWIRYCNDRRLHAALFYLPLDDVFAGRMGIRLAGRREKLHTVCISRRSYRQAQAAKL
jgi:hypothetical protein